MNDEKDLMVISDEKTDLQIARAPEIVLAEAKKAAHALSDVIANKKKPVIFNGEQYLEFEDWQTVGRFYGVTAKIVSTEFVDFGAANGFLARAVALRPDGMEISAAEAMCLNDEPNWSKKPLFQLRSMAQTRACCKALRNVLAWVVVLAGYKATPAEEIQDMANSKPPIQQPQEKAPNSSHTHGDGRTISDAQRKRFYAIAKKGNASDDAIKDWLYREFGFEHSKDITTDVYEAICTRVEKELTA